jgi:hypothetical protein
MITPEVPAMRFFGPIQVPAGQYFVMGDNRDESGDSRAFGFVPEDSIAGRVTAVAASVDPSNYYLALAPLPAHSALEAGAGPTGQGLAPRGRGVGRLPPTLPDFQRSAHAAMARIAGSISAPRSVRLYCTRTGGRSGRRGERSSPLELPQALGEQSVGEAGDRRQQLVEPPRPAARARITRPRPAPADQLHNPVKERAERGHGCGSFLTFDSLRMT